MEEVEELAGDERPEVRLKFSSSAISFIIRIFRKFGAGSIYIMLEVIFLIARTLKGTIHPPKG